VIVVMADLPADSDGEVAAAHVLTGIAHFLEKSLS
jgi:hypothetical protein